MIGQTVTHYKILEKLGEGGMGVVYKAEDTKLKRNVALKFFPAYSTVDEDDTFRFFREARAAAALDHPNICPVYEINDSRERPFIVMGYVHGRSLHQILKETTLSVDQVLDYAIQIAAGLEAAHEKGIIHRDIKPANIMVSEQGTVRITDFGIAKLADASRATRTGTMMGTTAYMSPEQTRGEPVDHRSDIWSLGVLLYEALTRRRPFDGDIEASVMYSVLMDDPVPLSSIRSDVPPELDRVIKKALTKDPDNRYRSVSDMRHDLVALSKQGTIGNRIASLYADNRFDLKRKRFTRRLVMGAGLLLGAAMIWMVALLSSPSLTELAPTVTPRSVVAVLGLHDESNATETAWLSTALTEMLITEFSAVPVLRTIPGEVINRLQAEVPLTDYRRPDVRALTMVRLNIGADLVLHGTYRTEGDRAEDRLHLDLQVRDALSGEVLASAQDTGSQMQLADLASGIVRRLLRSLGIEPSTDRKPLTLPEDLETMQLYATGLEHLRRFDVNGAVASFEQLIAVDPEYAPAHAALAQAWMIAGYTEQAQAAVRRALASADGLSREDRLLIEGRFHETMDAWADAVDTYKILYGFFPDNLEYGLRLAQAQVNAEQTGEALETIETLRRLPPPASQDARIDLAETKAAIAVSDFERARIAAVRAKAKASTQGAALLLAEAWAQEGWTLWNLGDPARALAAYEEARTHYESVGYRGRVAEQLSDIAVVKTDQGALDEAAELLNEALKIARELGLKDLLATFHNNLNNVYKRKGNLEKAKIELEEAISIRRELGQEAALTTNLSNMANVLREMGDLTGAERYYIEAVESAHRIGRKHTEANALMNLAELRHTIGDLKGARQAHETAYRLSMEINRRRDAAFSLWGLGRIHLTEGDLDRALALYDSATTMYRAIEFDLDAESTRIWIVEALIEQGTYGEAEAVLQEAGVRVREGNLQYEELYAEALSVRLYFERGRLAEARQAVEHMRALAGSNQSFELGAFLTIAAARVDAASGRADEAVIRLQEVEDESDRLQFVGLVFETRLARAEIDMMQGKTAAAYRQLEALEREAEEKGFGLIARRAAAARNR